MAGVLVRTKETATKMDTVTEGHVMREMKRCSCKVKTALPEARMRPARALHEPCLILISDFEFLDPRDKLFLLSKPSRVGYFVRPTLAG